MVEQRFISEMPDNHGVKRSDSLTDIFFSFSDGRLKPSFFLLIS